MPAFIRTKGDEARWSKAKKAAGKTLSEADGDSYWALTNSIYQKMTKADFVKSLLDKLEKRHDDDEEEEEHDIQDHGQDDEDDGDDFESHGFRVGDAEEEENPDADKWLEENDPGRKPEAKASEEVPEEAAPKEEAQVKEERQPSKSAYTEWQPRKDYSPDEQAAMDKYMKEGHTHREAERLAGAAKGTPASMQDAMTSTVKPSEHSEAMRGKLKPLVAEWLQNADRHARIHADPEANPQKYAAGQMMQAHEGVTKDYNKAYNDFLGSDQVKDLKGMDRHKAIQSWKQDWKTKNPEYGQNASKVHEAAKQYTEAPAARSKNLEDTLQHIMHGGVSGEPTYSMAEAAQHIGNVKSGEDERPSAATVGGRSAAFAADNKKLMDMLRSRAKPEQLDRLNRVNSARASFGVGKKPEGEK